MKKEFKIGIFVFIVLAVLSYFIIKTESLTSVFSKNKYYTIYGKFNSVSGLFKTAHVRVAGVRIGMVKDIYLEDNRAIVKLNVRKGFTITEDARAVISSVGIVGENFVEVVYKDEFKTKNPKIIAPEGFIKTTTSPGLESISKKFEVISDKVGTMLDSLNNVIAQKQSQDDIKAILTNLKGITGNLKDLSAKNGKLDGVFNQVEQISAQLKSSIKGLDKLVGSLDKSLYNKDSGILSQMEDVAGKVKDITKNLEEITGNIKSGKGTAGKLLNDEALYTKINDSIDSAKNIINDLEKKTKSLSKTNLNYFAGVDYFTGDKQARFSFGLNLKLSQLTLFTRVREDAFNGDPYFTVMAGKQFKFFTAAAGMVDSGLGASLSFHFLKKKLNLEVEASQFYRTDSPVLKTNLSFFLTKSINLSLGYEDLTEKAGRKFRLGIAYSN